MFDGANERTGTWTTDEDSKLKDAVITHGGKIGVQLPRWSQVERKVSVIPDGAMPWIPASAERVVNGQKTRTTS
jgi:hypothetical protein